MFSLLGLFKLAATISLSSGIVDGAAAAKDPCKAIANQTWVAPADVRACFQSFPLNNTLKNNVLDVVNLTFNFQTSINYQIQAPAPFAQDVHVDIAAELARIRAQHYASEFDFHLDLSRTVKRLQDGHTVYLDFCYDSTYTTFVPFPVVLLTENGKQQLHIAPEAFNVSSVELADEISFWEKKAHLDLAKFSGAAILAINEEDPWNAINANAAITGSFQALTTRQNKFFSSYIAAASPTGWSYRMGDFAQQSLPLTDSVKLTVQTVGSSHSETINVPYRSRFGASTGSVPFSDGPSFRAGNCVAIDGTNGIALPESKVVPAAKTRAPNPGGRFAPPIAPSDLRRARNAIVNEEPISDIALPPGLAPTPISGSGAIQFFELADAKTGVLALGSFSSGTFDGMESQLFSGLQKLKADGMTRLIVDLNNNGGGFICIAHWLHRIIVGPNANSVPQAGLDTKARDQEIAQLIVAAIDQGSDPDNQTLYNPINWSNASNIPFPPLSDWLQPPVKLTINGHPDMFSQRLGQECQPFDMTPPDAPLFDTKDIAIVNNGLCASSCALFSIALSKHYNVTTVVVGGKEGTTQQYTGTVGGQSSDFSTMDSEVKTAGLKSNPLAPPDFMTNSFQGITWRLGFGIFDPTQPEEWQDHFATVNFPVSADTVNNPLAIWNAVAKGVFS
ncbi:hypothetical protein BU17DRAFT_48809 [Hysterangium stoloniferum]|nr:hypothetical protein BU17DRAFT_48809 [Hysterangium stoloniferum]